MRRRAVRLRRLLLLMCLILLGGAAWYHEQILSSAGEWLNVSKPLDQPVEYVYVLGGGPRTRPYSAAAIVKSGMAERILLPRPKPDSAAEKGVRPDEVEILRAVILQQGVDDRAIEELPTEVDSTIDEARQIKQFLVQRPQVRIALVTNDFHTRRTRSIFSEELGPLSSQVLLVGTPTDGFGPRNYWKFETGITTYASEYAKFLWHFVQTVSNRVAEIVMRWTL